MAISGPAHADHHPRGRHEDPCLPDRSPSTATAGNACSSPAGLAALGIVAPDYVMPNGFLATDGARSTTPASTGQLRALAGGRHQRHQSHRNRERELRHQFAGAAAAVPALPVTAVEFRHAGLDHYFISACSRISMRSTAAASLAGSAPASRSRFWPIRRTAIIPCAASPFGPSTANPTSSRRRPPNASPFANWPRPIPTSASTSLESPAVFFVALPDTATGACPDATVPVYRLWNRRADSNHRYTTSTAIKA